MRVTWQWLIFKRALGRRNRFKPFSRSFGHDRGRPIDRYYIDRFIATEAACIHGHVLEVGDRYYTQAYGNGRVIRSDVLSPVPDSDATIVADLQSAPQIADGSFDCVILTQVLQCVYDHHAAVRTVWRILKPQGVVLATLPFLSVLSGVDMAQWGESWRYTSRSAHRLFADVFGPEAVEVSSYGNLVLAMAYLNGFAVEELDPADFEYMDPLIELISTVKATRSAAA